MLIELKEIILLKAQRLSTLGPGLELPDRIERACVSDAFAQVRGRGGRGEEKEEKGRGGGGERRRLGREKERRRERELGGLRG